MPNFHTTSLDKINYPTSLDGVEFLWEVRGGGERLVRVGVDGVEFFLTVYEKKGLVKYEKISRPSQVRVLQNALKAFEKISNSQTTHSNIHSSKNHLESYSEFLKQPEYFLDFEAEKIAIEVGFGSGRHLLFQARQNPDTLHVGVEIYQPSIDQVLKQIEAEGLKNVVLVDYDARILLEFFGSNSVDKIFVHFPVPWDKKPHRRVISKAFLNEAIRALKKGGGLELRTDSELYYDYSVDVFSSPHTAKLSIFKNRELGVSSKYEDRWKRQEKDIYDLIFENLELSQSNQKLEYLDFEGISVEEFNDNSFTCRGEDWFVNVKKVYKGDGVSTLQLSLGANDRPESRFIIEQNGALSYFPAPLLGTNANTNAHKCLVEWIKNANSN